MDQHEGVWCPKTESDKQLVRDQLEKILADQHFRTSKRYPAFLSFVVNQTMQGNEDALKERLLGIEVFHRPADYDTNLDPVVRLSAAEVRKRLAQYYQRPEHQQELRIDLNPGSYIPIFCHPAYRVGVDPSLAIRGTESLVVLGAWFKHYWIWAASVLLALVVIGGILAFVVRPNVVDQFWAQITSSPGRVTLCVGDPDDVGTAIVQNTPAPQTFYNELLSENHYVGADVVTLIRAGAALEAHAKPYRLATASHTVFPQLREGPAVFVGALDNAWTMRLMQPLRFGFVNDSESARIIDSKNPQAKGWYVRMNQTQFNQSSDYGVIARYRDTTIGQPVVIIAGLSSEGTEAAGEMLSNPDSLRALFKDTHRDWSTINLEAVIETQVVDGHPGPPRIVAVEYW